MIITRQKPFEEITGYLSSYTTIFIAGCSECATLCQTGGEEQVKEMKEKLEKSRQKPGVIPVPGNTGGSAVSSAISPPGGQASGAKGVI